MDFNLSPEDRAFRDEIRGWLDANLPAAERIPTIDLFFQENDDSYQHRFKWHRKMHQAGWVGVGWPREYGGRGATVLQQTLYNEEIYRANAPSIVNSLGIMMVGPTLIRWGTEEQKRRYIPKILSAEEIWCQGYSEPNSGSDLASLQTHAVEDGDYFVVNGSKVWTTDAQRADMCILLVRTDPAAPKHRGISYLLVDMHSPGITVRPLVQMTGASGFNQVFFEDVRVPKKNIVGEKNRGWDVAVTTLMYERVSVGDHRDFVNLTRELAELARLIKRNERPAWEDSDVRQHIARLAAEASALRLTGLRQLSRQMRGDAPGPEGSILKLVASELNFRICMYAMELMGPYSQLAYGAPYAPEGGKWLVRMLGARSLMIAGGTSEIQRGILGDRVLNLPRS